MIPWSMASRALSGGMTNDVFVPVERPDLVVKVFQGGRADEPEQEWDAA